MAADPWKAFVEFYDAFPIYVERKDVDFYLRHAKAAGGPVLELGCGSGRILVPTRRAGIDITGLDGSADMLAACRAKLEGENLDASLLVGDMRDFDIGRKFALVTIPFRPFQHLLDVEDQMACLKCIREHLRPGGRLIFDVFNPRMDLIATQGPEIVPEATFDLPDGRRIERSHRRLAHDRARQVMTIEIIHQVVGGEQTSLTIEMHYFFRFELEHLLARCGFRVERLFGGLDESPFGQDSQEMIFVAVPA